MTYKEVRISKPEPVGIGRMQATFRYTYTKPKWGVIPITHHEADVLCYRTYMSGDKKVVVEERSITTKKLDHHIDADLKKKILAALVSDGHADLTQL